MKVMIATTPIRPNPTDFPPIGSLSLIKYLRKNGYDDVELYHIDAERPEYEDVLAHIKAEKPDVFGISAVVSTAYAYTKQLADDVKAMLPDTLIVVGGSLAASAEVLLRRTGIDICVLGEGEKVLLNIVRRAEETIDTDKYQDIPGIMILDKNDALINTGYETALTADEVYDYDWDDLEKASDIDIYFTNAITEDGPFHMYRDDPRAYEPHRADKRIARVPGAKGCVARCTFCHRWDKGIRYIPVDRFFARVEEVIERYNVGFLEIVDENFGTDKRWLKEFCERMKLYDLLWRVGGMRVNCVTPEIIEMMRDAGCSSIQYGMETGSEKMLDVMEKKVKLEDNYNAMKWTIDAGVRTIVQLVICMPGESPETIKETAEFVKYANTLDRRQCALNFSVNYAQALPGTPLYEFGRRKGLIEPGLDGEEKYLMSISDRNAHDEETTLNFTEYPTLLCLAWRTYIQISVFAAYFKKFGKAHYIEMLLKETPIFRKKPKDDGYFANPRRIIDRSETTDTINEVKKQYDLEEDGSLPSFWSLITSGKIGLASMCYPMVFKLLLPLLTPLMILRSLRYRGSKYMSGLVKEYLAWRLGMGPRKTFEFAHKSLRKALSNDIAPMTDDSSVMEPLRRGR